MDHMESRGGDFDVDLESGGRTDDEDGIGESNSNGKQMKRWLGRPWSGRLGVREPVRGREGLTSYNKVFNSNENFANANKLGQEMATLVDKEMEETRKKTSSKVPSKPPRPPRRPNLDAADTKFVREFSELAALKRKRVEQMKLFRKKRSEKVSSLKSNLVSLFVTMIFFFVIIFQGIFLRNPQAR
ncbi:hypothetical protein NMG60_11020915 [Bertholletia excelsa]